MATPSASHSLGSAGVFSDPSSNEHQLSLLDDIEPTERAEDHHQPANTSKASQSRTSTLVQGLIYEFLSLVVAATSFLGLLILLKAYDDKPQPGWTFGPWFQSISLNAIVSIVSTVFRSCLVFPVATCIAQFGWIWMASPRGRSLRDLSSYDSASRGPLGSLLLLWRLRFWHLASIGAIIMLIASALGPFFQQSVEYKLKSVVDPTYTPSSNAVAAYSWGGDLSGWSHAENAHQNLPYDMRAAILNGLLAPNPLSTPKPPYNCPTGNCTWESFGTLSVNSRCIDLSSHVKVSSKKDGNETKYYLKASDDNILQGMLNKSNGSNEYRIFYLTSSMPSLMDPSILQPFLNMTAAMVIVHWIKVRPDNSSVRFKLIEQNSTIEAFRCAIYFSAKEILPQVRDGVYSEQVLQEITRPDNIQFLADNTGARKHFVYIHDTWDPLVLRLPGLPPNRTNKFVVPLMGFIPLYSQLNHDLSGMVSLSSRVYSEDMIPIMLYKTDSVVRAIHNMADSITTQMRRNGSDINPEQAIKGHVWIQQPFVVVRWAWLALPAVMLAFTFLFLVAVVIETRRSGIGLWLSSPLALFFNAQLDSGGKSVLDNASPESLNTADGMLNVATLLDTRIVKGSREINIVASRLVKPQVGDLGLNFIRRS